MTYVCITGNEESPERLEKRIERVLSSNPKLLCELRLDYLDMSPSSAFAFLAKLRPEWSPRLILTQRLKASGAIANGRCTWDILTWQSWWKDVMALKPWFAVDLDWLVLDQLVGESLNWRGTFRSRHAFFSLHANIIEIAEFLPELEASARTHNAGIKIAAPVKSVSDLNALAQLTESFQHKHPLKVAVAMGIAGRAWRWSRLVGNISYFSIEAKSATATGQDTFENVLPYVNAPVMPELYVLWSADEKNTFGETEWNRVFASRGKNARYVNIAVSDLPESGNPMEKRRWAVEALDWMRKAGVQGASVTKPFKDCFPLELGGELSINTLKVDQDKWFTKNTDALAVEKILKENQSSWREQKILVLGGGGAAQAVKNFFEKEKVKVELLRREKTGVLPDPIEKNPDILISTWPGKEQVILQTELERKKLSNVKLCIDAQFSIEEEESPLAHWCKKQDILYVHGLRWWKEQALAQDDFWFSNENRLGEAQKKILDLVPTSKSEMNRILLIASIREGKTEIQAPSICSDTEVMAAALEKLGLEIEKRENSWLLYSSSYLESRGDVLEFQDCATAIRTTAALAPVIKGKILRLNASKGLQARPMEDLFAALEQSFSGSWPIEISLPALFPKSIAVDKTSQFASGFLIAAAAKTKESGKEEEFSLIGEMRSEPYFLLTQSLLKKAGFSLSQKENKIFISTTGEEKNIWKHKVAPDASALSFLEVIGAFLNLPSFYTKDILESDQGDKVFPKLLNEVIHQKEPEISLKNYPDLAPALWSAAILFRKSLVIIDAPHLHHKECDRALALVDAAKKLGIPAENKNDGFFIDANHFTNPERILELRTYGDHRMAMAFAVLQFFYPLITIDNKICVEKSFPKFWDALKLLQAALP